ncbi:MAG: hypothetical protein JEZ09_00020 [Salinivirgaceae bacterium]|nr:hypothetical protein [Salinivirgaceae bacterium]
MLIKYWMEFAEQIKTDKPRIYQVLKAHQPIIKNDNILVLQLDSDGQKKDLADRIQNKLMGFLKKNLNNYKIELITELISKENENKIVYTATDKFNYLAEQNELLLTLKKNLNLDLE